MRLTRKTLEELHLGQRNPQSVEALKVAAEILAAVEAEGAPAVRRYAERFGDLSVGAPLVLPPEALSAAEQSLEKPQRELLERVADRIRSFAEAQRRSLHELRHVVPGGIAEQIVAPVERAGCYAPGGRFPLPSSVLMTALTARVAGVREVILASPKPAPIVLAAAKVAGVDAVLQVGGAQAIAALTFGCDPLLPADVVVGPGNRYVTAAKQLVAGRVKIDFLAGPSELVVLADEAQDPELIAADLLAQAEHDPDARAILVTTDERLLLAVEVELSRQLVTLPTQKTAEAALRASFVLLLPTLEQCIEAINRIAPEHLEIQLSHPELLLERTLHYGALFMGAGSAEVIGDYGAGPNHVLPTGGTARAFGGLSVLTFMRVRTRLEISDPEAALELYEDARALAELEGLHAHARAAERRQRPKLNPTAR